MGASHDDAGGYHLVWTRDTVEAAFALITAGQYEDAGRTLDYLIGTQAPEGNWAQNYYPDGRGYWTGKQLDEVALPVLLASKLRAVGHLTNSPPEMAMVRTAIDFIVRNGPMSDQDRWEENAGASPFTLAVVVAALVTSADYYAGADRDYLLSLADCWNERIEDWTYVVDGRLGRDLGLPGYYIRLAPRPDEGGPEGIVSRRNVMHGDVPAGELIGMEFLYLVRTGLRSADDPRVVATVKLVDKLLAAQTPAGIGYYRYNGDGYGEHEDGAPFDGQGVGRLWPLLTGERGHFALSEGADVTPYLEAMMRMVGRGGLIPEQIWDSADITDFGLETGKPTGSAMPLVWAHSEFLKLLAAHQTGTPAEQFDAVVTRYRGAPPVAATWHWRETSAFSRLPVGRGLSIEATQPLSLHIGFNNWRRVKDVQLVENGLGMFVYHLHPEALTGISSVQFTFFDPAREQWRGRDFKIDIVGK